MTQISTLKKHEKPRKNNTRNKSLSLLQMRHPTMMVNFLTSKLRLYNFRAILASKVLAQQSRKCRNIGEYIALTCDVFSKFPLKYLGWSIKPAQVPQELEELLTKLSNFNVNRMLEVGTFNGGTLYLFTRIINSNAEIISLDLVGGAFGGGYEAFKMPFFTNLLSPNRKFI